MLRGLLDCVVIRAYVPLAGFTSGWPNQMRFSALISSQRNWSFTRSLYRYVFFMNDMSQLLIDACLRSFHCHGTRLAVNAGNTFSASRLNHWSIVRLSIFGLTPVAMALGSDRSEERRVGKECRSRW